MSSESVTLCSLLYFLSPKEVVVDQLKLFLLFFYLDCISETGPDGEGNEQEKNYKVVLPQANGHHS